MKIKKEAAGPQARRDEYSTEYELQEARISSEAAAEEYIATEEIVKAYNTKTTAA